MHQPLDHDSIHVQNGNSHLINNLEADTKERPSSHGRFRYVISILTAFMLIVLNGTRACMNVSLVVMVNSTLGKPSGNSTEECPGPDTYSNSTSTKEVGEFNWSADMQSQILAFFFYGYVITQLPGGYLAQRFGSKYILGWMLLSSSLLCAAVPFLARLDVRALIASRFLMGFFQGPLFPSVQALWSLWAPPLERTRLMAIGSAGATIGDLIGLALSGVLCNLDIVGGWPLPFYVFGGSAFLCFILWMIVYNDPIHQRCVSESERRYISTEIYGPGGRPEYVHPPWRSILTCRAFYALLICTSCGGISYYVIFNCGPTYMKQVLNFDVTENGLVNAAPYVSSFVVSLAAGPAADFIITKGWMSVTVTRKAFTLFGGLVAAGFLIAIGYVDCDRTLAVVFLVTSWGVGGLTTAGPGISSLDISPEHAGPIMGVLNTFNNCGGFISPALVLWITEGKGSRYQWRKVFLLTGAVTAVGFISYAVLGSSRKQKWSVINELEVSIQSSDNNDDNNERKPLLAK